jgi:hypothetical protein
MPDDDVRVLANASMLAVVIVLAKSRTKGDLTVSGTMLLMHGLYRPARLPHTAQGSRGWGGYALSLHLLGSR